MTFGAIARQSALALGLGLGLAAPAPAAQLTDLYQTRVNIQTSCAVTATDLDFGAVGIITGSQTATATVQVICSSGTPFALSFSPSATVTSFAGQMVNGPNQVNYQAVLIGPNAGIGSTTRTILGNLPLQPAPPTGIYVDNRTIYLNY